MASAKKTEKPKSRWAVIGEWTLRFIGPAGAGAILLAIVQSATKPPTKAEDEHMSRLTSPSCTPCPDCPAVEMSCPTVECPGGFRVTSTPTKLGTVSRVTFPIPPPGHLEGGRNPASARMELDVVTETDEEGTTTSLAVLRKIRETSMYDEPQLASLELHMDLNNLGDAGAVQLITDDAGLPPYPFEDDHDQ